LLLSPFSLDWGYNIYARIIGYNIYGNSALSDPGFDAIILTNPDPPVSLAETVDSRSKTSITFSWQDGEEDGGAPVIDYRINFDQALDNYVIRASGITTNSFTATGLTAGLTYKFKVEARNSFDYSAYSQEIAIICATIPSVPATPTTANTNSKILVDWVAPANNGLTITSYSVLI